MKRRTFLQASLGAAALWPARMLLANGVSLADIPAISLAGATTTLHGNDIADLAASVRGQVLVSGQPGYDQARRVWNGMFDKQPALIVRCAAPSDVMKAVAFAHDHALLTAVRAGGHSVSGKSTCDGGIVIDVSPMQAVRVDPTARIAHVEGGALLGHLDRETRMFNLVTTSGTVSHTGAAGLTLGGGLGRVGRRFGLASDNLVCVDLVTADGRLIRASDEEHADLFWGLRGGGGNFGVATAFRYRLHPMDPTVLAGRIAWPMAQIREVLAFYAEFAANAPDELNADFAASWTPNGPLCTVQVCWSANMTEGERVLRPLRSFGKPVLDQIAAMPYVQLQTSSDAGTAAGKRYYTKSGYFAELTPKTIDTIADVLESAPPDRFALVMQQAGGAISRQPLDATAYPNRNAQFWAMLIASWTDPALDDQHIAPMRAAWKRIEPRTQGFYVNAMSESDDAKVAANYGRNYPRLQRIKRAYDPNNLFRLNANISPARES